MNLFLYHTLSTSVLLKQPFNNNWFAVRNIRDNEPVASLPKLSHTRIKVALQQFMCRGQAMEGGTSVA